MSKEFCTITKVYNFSAGHRLHNTKYTEEENWKIFGKCSNEKGHGHDYYVEVKVTGAISTETGMIVDLPLLDRWMSEILDELDHKRLDLEIPFFMENQPSGELIVKYIWQKMEPLIKKHETASLHHLKLWETPNNYFEYFENGST